MADLSAAEQRAIDLVALLLQIHSGREGEGLFAGPARYAALDQRLRLAAERAPSLRALWDRLARAMLWPLPIAKYHAAILLLLEPDIDEGEALRALAERTQSIIMLAREKMRSQRDPCSSQSLPLARTGGQADEEPPP